MMRTGVILNRISIVFYLALLCGGRLVSSAYASDIGVEEIVVRPATPGPSTLCTLKVRLKNSGNRAASYFAFNIKVEGQDVPTYKSQTFVVNIDPGATAELDLNNFYSPAASKPFTVQVSLVEAQWVQVKKEGATTTTTPLGPVTGLPVSASIPVKMSASK